MIVYILEELGIGVCKALLLERRSVAEPVGNRKRLVEVTLDGFEFGRLHGWCFFLWPRGASEELDNMCLFGVEEQVEYRHLRNFPVNLFRENPTIAAWLGVSC